MLIKWKVPKTIQWVVKLFFIFLLVFTLFRVSTYLAFKPEEIRLQEVLPSFVLGMRFDIRWISLLLIPMVVGSLVPGWSPYSSDATRRIWVIYLATATFLLMFFFGADYGHFAYVSTRLNASALNFYEDAKISMEMLWESYPILWMLAALSVAAWLFYQMYNRTHQRVEKNNSLAEINYRRRWYAVVLLFLLWGVYGSTSTRPLKWEDAFVYRNNFKTYLALNPMQNFFTTLRFRKPQADERTVQYVYQQVADFLQLDKGQRQG
ncbi:MAG: hypothetical protein MUF29_00175, partial [Chitinophagaceae bacterium]|nr:hypothetical protein [Chitinophagaceae bacterium]